MDALLLVLCSGAALLAAYFTLGRWLSTRVFQLDDSRETPAFTERDDCDYCPTRKSIIFGHHFTSIAGTGPIVGPAIAVMWGWLPAIIWVVLGAIFVGAVHDLGSIVVSLRNKGRSIGDVAGDLLGPRARFVFLGILIVGLWIVLAVFGLVISAVLRQYPAAIFPVLVQIPLALVIGATVHRRGGAIFWPSVIALAVMYASVVWGDWGVLGAFNAAMAAQPLWLWTAGLLAYAYVASVLPVWVLLQPRDYINALQLISALGLIVVGLVVAAIFGGPVDHAHGLEPVGLGAQVEATRPTLELVAPMIDWQPEGAPPMLPVLFITIACGACSGFHCLVGSGTTSKQISNERDARAVGYGSMLTEGFLATLVIAACAAGVGLGIDRGIHRFLQPHVSSIAEAATANMRAGMYAGSVNLPIPDGPPILVRTHERSDSLGESQVVVYKGDEVVRSSFGDWIDTEFGQIRGTGPLEVELRGRLAFNKQYESWAAAGSLGAKVGAFVEGAANFVASLGIPLKIAIALMAVMVASFAATTMDTACRLQRYVVQELARTFLPRIGKKGCVQCGYDLSGLDEAARAGTGGSPGPGEPGLPPNGGGPPNENQTCPECGCSNDLSLPVPRDHPASVGAASVLNPFKWLATTHGATLFAVATALVLAFIPAPGTAWSLDNAGKGGLILWPLFGATNQLLAGFAFVVITAWLIATKRPWAFAILPGVFMLAVPASAMTWQAFIGNEANPSWIAQRNWLLVSVATVTLVLEAWLLVEVVVRWRSRGPRTTLT